MKRNELPSLLVVLGLAGVSAAGQQAPYSGLEARDIKALSPQEIAGYLAGEGMGLALAAELNRYPGPKHVLELRDELELTERQLTSTQAVLEEMCSTAKRLGKTILERERQLDRLFAEERISEEDLESLVAEIAELRGKLRVTHLGAHLRMVKILSREQADRYVSYRGYGEGTEHQKHGSGHQHNP